MGCWAWFWLSLSRRPSRSFCWIYMMKAPPSPYPLTPKFRCEGHKQWRFNLGLGRVTRTGGLCGRSPGGRRDYVVIRGLVILPGEEGQQPTRNKWRGQQLQLVLEAGY